MIKVYCCSKCNTCKKALKWLDNNGIAYKLTNVKANSIKSEVNNL